MNQLTFLFQLSGFSLDQIEIQTDVVVLQAHVQALEAACPFASTLLVAFTVTTLEPFTICHVEADSFDFS